jgi:hypothetical protein
MLLLEEEEDYVERHQTREGEEMGTVTLCLV